MPKTFSQLAPYVDNYTSFILIMVGMRRKMKNVRFQYGAANYEKPNSLRITGRKDIYLYKKVTRTKRASSSSSSNRRR